MQMLTKALHVPNAHALVKIRQLEDYAWVLARSRFDLYRKMMFRYTYIIKISNQELGQPTPG